jgi:hypothetical protein
MRQLITQTSEILIKYSLITPLFQLADAQKVYITGALELLGAHLLFPLLFSTLCVCLVVSFPFDRLANKLTCYSGRSFSKIFKYLSSAARRPPLCSRFADERPGNRINRRKKRTRRLRMSKSGAAVGCQGVIQRFNSLFSCCAVACVATSVTNCVITQLD